MTAYFYYADFFIDLKRGRKRREKERNINVGDIDLFLPPHAPNGDRTHHLGMCPNQKLSPPTLNAWMG